MVENHRNLCYFSYLNNAIFQPTKMKNALFGSTQEAYKNDK